MTSSHVTRGDRSRARRRRHHLLVCAAYSTVIGLVLGFCLLAVEARTATGMQLTAQVQSGDQQVSTVWQDVKGATGYTVRVSRSRSMSSPITRHAAAGQHSLAVRALRNGRIYYVQVFAEGKRVVSTGVLTTRTTADAPSQISSITAEPAGPNQVRVTWAGDGASTGVAVVAGSTPAADRHRFASRWYPAATRSITLTVPWSLRSALGAGSGNEVYVRLAQANTASDAPLSARQGGGVTISAAVGHALAGSEAPSSPTATTPTPTQSPAETAGDATASLGTDPAPSSPTGTPVPTTTSTASDSSPAPSPSTTTGSDMSSPQSGSPTGAGSFAHLSATDYGAVGDGRTDDQAALDAAIRAARSAGSPLYLPPGKYVHSARIELNGVVLYGSSSATTELHGTTVVNHAVDLTGTGPAIVNVTVSGPGASPRTSDRGGNGIYVDNATRYLIRNTHIRDVSGAGVMVENSSSGVERNNLVERTGADGMYHTESTHDVEISYNRTIATGDDAISVTTYGTKYAYNIDIHHNSVMGNFQSRAITVNGTSGGIRIHDNYIDGGTAGLSFTSYSGWGTAQTRGVEAYGNTIRNINQSLHDTGTIGGGAISFWNDQPGQDTGLSIHDNQIFAPGLYGIYVGGSSSIDASVTNNSFFMSGTLFHSDNAQATIDRTGSATAAVTALVKDVVSSAVGGLDTGYSYSP